MTYYQRPKLPRLLPSKRMRRGAILVIVAVALTGLVGIAGLAIDFARAYAFKTQLKVLADAAALSAAKDLMLNSTRETAVSKAIVLSAANKVENQTVPPSDITVEHGRWIRSTVPSTFEPASNQSELTWQQASAVRVTAQYEVQWSLARIFGGDKRMLVESSVASLGSANTAYCVKPFGFSIQSLIFAARNLPSSTVLSPSELYLERSDIDALTLSQTPKAYYQGDLATTAGNFSYVLNYKPNNNVTLQDVIPFIGASKCLQNVTVGQTIFAATGAGVTNANGALKELETVCLGRVGSSSTWDCTNGSGSSTNIFYMPIYGQPAGQGQSGTYEIQYIGYFELTKVQYGSSGGDILWGRMLKLDNSPTTATGGFNPGLGPIRSRGVALVQ